MTLQQCTKAELLWVIDRACLHGMSKRHIEYALSDLEREKISRELDEADRLNKLAHEKRMEYIELLKPYDGWKFKDIPLDVLEKAQAALDQAQEADRKWDKLMLGKKK